MHHDDVTLAHVAKHRAQLGAVDILAAGLVFEELIELDPLQLPGSVLVRGAEASILPDLSL